MSKKAKWKLWILVAVVAICLIPWPIPYHKTLNAVKLDVRGNELGTVQIPLDGTRWASLLLADRLKVTMGPIEDFPRTVVDTIEFEPQIMEEFLSLSIGIHDTSYEGDLKDAIINDPGSIVTHGYAYHMHLSRDHDRWLIHIVQDNKLETYYMGSVSGNDSVPELLEYFGHAAPGN